MAYFKPLPPFQDNIFLTIAQSGGNGKASVSSIPNYSTHEEVKQANGHEDWNLQQVLHIVVAISWQQLIVDEHGHAVANTVSCKEGHDRVVHLSGDEPTGDQRTGVDRHVLSPLTLYKSL